MPAARPKPIKSRSPDRLGHWVDPHPQGIYLPAADARVDPSVTVPCALITLGHADHARGGHGEMWATLETLAIMGARYGDQNGHPVAYGEALRLGEINVGFVSADHVLDSAQIVLDHAGS